MASVNATLNSLKELASLPRVIRERIGKLGMVQIRVTFYRTIVKKTGHGFHNGSSS